MAYSPPEIKSTKRLFSKKMLWIMNFVLLALIWALSAPLRQQEEAAAREEQLRYEHTVKAREERIAASEAALQKREDGVGARETELSQRFEALDAEVVLRARSGVAAAEAREAACQKLGAMREERAMQRLASFADAETALAVREMRVAARERALEAKNNALLCFPDLLKLVCPCMRPRSGRTADWWLRSRRA